MILSGTRRLARLPADDVRHLAYEDLLAAPVDVLAQVIDFLDLPAAPPSVLTAAVRPVRQAPAAWQELPQEQLRRLEAACAPGMQRLAALSADVHLRPAGAR